MDIDGNKGVIASVTGASGMVGSKIVDLLLMRGYTVRILTRKQSYNKQRVEIVRGSLESREALAKLVRNARLLFHCAGELHNEAAMWEVNVKGTERLIGQIAESEIEYFCHLSSAGVVGKTNLKLVNEETPCCPDNLYEKSKFTAEQLVSRCVNQCRVVILRPTNVIDDKEPGALNPPMRSSWSDYLKVFIKGGECAHIIHAMDVADAAVYLISATASGPSCFFVSCDHERLNTFAGLWSFYRDIERNRPVKKIEPITHMPMIVPYLFRKLCRGTGNLGNVRYSSEKLLSMGFRYRLGVEGAVRRIVSSRHLLSS